jgi:hypothetical protein
MCIRSKLKIEGDINNKVLFKKGGLTHKIDWLLITMGNCNFKTEYENDNVTGNHSCIVI